MILLDQVTKTYPGDEDPTLDNISLHIEPHEFVFLVGKSGAGKSTLIKMITKEEQPDTGKVIIGGIDLDYVRRRHIPHYRRRLGVVFQDYKLLPSRTVFENVAFALEIAGMSNREILRTVPKVLDLVGLSGCSHKFPSQLSGGQRQRVSIARSVARQPKILIADEPTGNLDPQTRKEIIDLLQRINDFGTTLLVTTHDEHIVNNLNKRVVTLKNGRIVNDQKINGVYRLDSEPVELPTQPAVHEEPLIIRTQPIVQTANARRSQASKKRLATSMQYTMHINHPQKQSKNVAAKEAPKQTKKEQEAENLLDSFIEQPIAVSKTADNKKPDKKYERDSANQWYAAGKPLKAAPKLSKLSPGQSVKLKPAPSIRQAIKPIPRKPKQKRVI